VREGLYRRKGGREGKGRRERESVKIRQGSACVDHHEPKKPEGKKKLNLDFFFKLNFKF